MNIYDEVYYKGHKKVILKYDPSNNMYFITWLNGTWVNECDLEVCE